jgi:phosphoribosyl 1,2-cyclic phosphodiesterase
MRLTLFGTRGSIPAPGPETARYGGNTPSIEVRGADGTVLVLDAGTGVRRLGAQLPADLARIDILLTHLHMDHIQGLGFFAPLYNPDMEVHIWGPGSAVMRLKARLMRYLSPPLFPVNISELACKLVVHDIPSGESQIGEFCVSTALVCHPGPTVGYRITEGKAVLAYLPDHEPALAALRFPCLPREWTSGATLAAGADLLIHDSQYSAAEYPGHCGWGHSSLDHALDFGTLAMVRELAPFHHDPSHTDAQIDRMTAQAIETAKPEYRVTPGREGTVFEL